MADTERVNSAFPWFPGSDEWSLSLPGGAFYNSTGVFRPWEMIAGISQNVDLSGILATEFFEYQSPADTSQRFAGSMWFYSDFNR